MCRKNDITTFLVAGRFDAKCRDMNLLLKTLSKLEKAGIKNFHLNIVGRIGTEPLSPQFARYSKNVSVFGDVTNAQLYEIAKKSDFVLGLLSPNNRDHVIDYTTNKTSGSFGLSVGFLKPIILNEFFAIKHDFSNENALLYDEDNLEKAVIRAIKLGMSDYKRMCKSLFIKKRQQEQESLNNLKQLINI